MRYFVAVLIVLGCLASVVTSTQCNDKQADSRIRQEAINASTGFRTGSGGGSDDKGTYRYVIDEALPADDNKLDSEKLDLLVVEWGHISVVRDEMYENSYLDKKRSAQEDDTANEDVPVEPDDDSKEILNELPPANLWVDDNTLHPSRMLAIRGRLLKHPLDGGPPVPLGRPQGIRVIVSKEPEKELDWSNGSDDANSIWEELFAGSNGDFMVIFGTGSIRRPVAKEARFQVALSLPHKMGSVVVWRTDHPVLPQSIAMLAIPGPPAISETMKIINGAPSLDCRNFDGAKLVRAVNHLVPMGKEKAIATLRQFLEMARDTYDPYSLKIDDNIDTSEKTSVFLITRLLFECDDTIQRLPPILAGVFAGIREKEDVTLFPYHPIYLHGDLPFYLASGGGTTGQPQQPEEHVDWAERHGRIRTTLLKPVDDPMAAARTVAGLPHIRRLYEDDKRLVEASTLRQAATIVLDARPQKSPPFPVFAIDDPCMEPEWVAIEEYARQGEIHWSEEKQQYLLLK